MSFNDFEAYVIGSFTNPRGRKHRRRTKRQQAERDLTIATLGLAGEAGEVVDHFKKMIRDHEGDPAAYPADKRRKLLLEFGDVFHYFVYLMHRAGLNLPQVMIANKRKLDRRYARKRDPRKARRGR